MELQDLPIVGAVIEAGPNDRPFDTLMLFGPVFVISVAILGRNAVTTVLGAAYVLGFAVYVLYKGVRRSDRAASEVRSET